MSNLFYQKGLKKAVHRRKLPHWFQEGKLYFVTFRAADALPEDQIAQLTVERQRWEASHRPPYSPAEWVERRRLFCERVEEWLDQGHGDCLLAVSTHAQRVQNAMGHFDGIRYRLDHWVIMPNHVHVLLAMLAGFTLEQVLHGWKSYTANQINRLARRSGQFWQHESFDHIVRSRVYLEKYRNYIIQNARSMPGRSYLSTRRLL